MVGKSIALMCRRSISTGHENISILPEDMMRRANFIEDSYSVEEQDARLIVSTALAD